MNVEREIERLRNDLNALLRVVRPSPDGVDFPANLWTDYSATATITGWASFTTQSIKYKRVGKTVFVEFYLDGVSNNAAATFTLPYAKGSGAATVGIISVRDNGGSFAVGVLTLLGGASTVNLYASAAGAGWTASGTKTVRGQFWYEAA